MIPPIPPNDHLGVAQDLTFSTSLDQLELYLGRKDFEAIIKDKVLFWLAYCKAISLHPNRMEHSSFLISIEGKKIVLSGKHHIIKKTQDFIEKMRNFFLEGLEGKKTSEILVIKHANKYHLRQESSLIDLIHRCDEYLDCCWYHQWIKPALPQLAEMCGAFYIEDKKNQLVRWHEHFPPETMNVEVIKIKWKEEEHLVYPIPPKAIPKQEELRNALYTSYQKQQMCDLSVISKDHTIKIHSIVLYLYGGATFQSLFTHSMQETINKTLSFAQYSHHTVLAFIDFIYLGGEAFSEKVIASNHTINLFELFVMANTYQVGMLIDCCTNLISLVAKKEDLETIRHLADVYDNQHLKLLCDHLSPKVNLIKV